MTEEEFLNALRLAPADTKHVANGFETVDENGATMWAIEEEIILDSTGRETASLLHSPPLFVDSGCPWRSGLRGERTL